VVLRRLPLAVVGVVVGVAQRIDGGEDSPRIVVRCSRDVAQRMVWVRTVGLAVGNV